MPKIQEDYDVVKINVFYRRGERGVVSNYIHVCMVSSFVNCGY